MTAAIDWGLVGWDRARERYALSALGRRCLDMFVPRPTGTRPKSTKDKSGGGRAGRLTIAGFAVMACLGLLAMVSTGSPRITSYFADPVPTLTAVSPAASAPAGGVAVYRLRSHRRRGRGPSNPAVTPNRQANKRPWPNRTSPQRSRLADRMSLTPAEQLRPPGRGRPGSQEPPEGALSAAEAFGT
jgi:hypothetical protein